MKNIHYITGIIFGLVLPFISFGATYDMYHTQQAFPASLPLGVYSRFNSVIPNSTSLRFNHFTRSNVDITSVLHAIQTNDIIKITDISGNYYLWLVTGTPTHYTIYDSVPVSYISTFGSDTTFNGYGANVDIDFDYIVPVPPPAVPSLFSFRNLQGDISTSPTDLVASVSIVSSDTFGGALPYMVLAIGLGVAFYLVQKLQETLKLKEKKDTKKSYDIVTEKSTDKTYHASFKERKKDL